MKRNRHAQTGKDGSRRIGVLIACAGLLLAADAAAQSPSSGGSVVAPTPQDAAEALRRFKAGVKLYGEKAYVEALSEFEASYKLGGRPSALRNVGQCQRDLKHFAEAYEAYDKLLKLNGAQLSASDKAAVAKALTELADLTGTIAVKSSEAGAAVDLDGRSLGTTPLEAPTRVSLAVHHLRVTKGGFEPFEKDVAVTSGGSVEVAATLATEVTTGHVTVREANGHPVHVFVDGQDKGPAPWDGELPPGDHVLELHSPGFAADERPFSLGRHQRLDLAADAQSTMGHVRITTSPGSAAITLDGEHVGTGAYDADVAPGRHKIEVSQAGVPTAAREISVQRGQLVAEEIPLEVGVTPVFRGFEGRFDLDFAVAPGAAHYKVPASAPPVPVNASDPLAFGATLRAGYAFDWYAVEFFGTYQMTLSSVSFTAAGAPASNGYTSFSPNFGKGIFGVAGRATSKTDTLRVTGSVGVGLAVATLIEFNFSPCSKAPAPPCPGPGDKPQDRYTPTSGYVAPAFVADLGILLGGPPPGAKLFLGVQAWVEVVPDLDSSPYPNPGYLKRYEDAPNGNGWKAAYGPVFFFGPMIGVGFGH